MATSSSSNSSDPFISVLHRSFPSAAPSSASDFDPNQLSHAIYPETTYTDNEKIEITQWLTTASRLATPDEDEAKHAERLGSLDTHLSTRTTLLGSKPSVADVALYARLAPAVSKWSAEERTGEHGYHHIVRHMDFVQNAPIFRLKLAEEDKVKVDVDDVRFIHKPLDPKEEKERKKKEKAEAAAAGGSEKDKPLVVGQGKGQGGGRNNKEKAKETVQEVKEEVRGVVAGDGAVQQPKKEKKEKQPKPQKQPAKETPLSPCLIDLRVGHILKAINHPNADSLYVSTIACGDPAGTENTSEYEGQVVRTVCSGLNGLVPLEEMQGRKIIAVCNLKPVTMRGVKSAAMVLAASPRVTEGEDGHAGPVELVTPPADAEAGERVYFQGWAGEPEGVLNPKKKIWESMQPGFTTTEDLEVGFDVGRVPQLQKEGEGEGVAGKEGLGKLVTVGGGVCTVKSLRGAVVR
ncbi:G4 quadruplex nucleic acid binding protein [Acarospora aff. strigata]|nr:G4 quadruplex nucleic acid binding protein [Acarospora aff. strigata]